MHWRIIGTLGLKSEEVEIVKNNLPQKHCEVMNADVATDIIATGEIAPFSETVIFVGNIELPENLK